MIEPMIQPSKDGFCITLKDQAQVLANVLEELNYPRIAKDIRRNADEKLVKVFARLAYRMAEKKNNTNAILHLDWVGLDSVLGISGGAQ